MTQEHIPVLVKEVLAIFEPIGISTFFDGTLGAGGHARALLEAHPEIKRYIGCDRDQNALTVAKKVLAPWGDKVRFIHGGYNELSKHVQSENLGSLDGILIDAGVSSMQLDQPERGFSFQKDGPLDMRMNTADSLTAQKIVNSFSQIELEDILRDYGEEPRARAISRIIVEARKKKPLCTTRDLVAVIAPVARGRKHLHFATLTFQALRIAVNDELRSLKKGIEEGIEALSVGGRIAVISFHRLEDRIAKCSLKDSQIRWSKEKKEWIGNLDVLTKNPLESSEEEARENPRSRSAKLRAAQKVDHV